MHREQKYNTYAAQRTAHNLHTISTQYAHTQTNIYICTEHNNTHICSITIQNTEYRIQDTRYKIQNIEYNNMQHTEQDNTEQENTEQHTETDTNNHAENKHTSTENSAHNYRTYSLDYYFEYAYIKNSNTIELYTILQENI